MQMSKYHITQSDESLRVRRERPSDVPVTAFALFCLNVWKPPSAVICSK